MIQLTRLNNSRLAVNCDLIKFVEQAPDTVITLVNGEKLVVRETAEQVIDRVRDFRRSVLMAGSGSQMRLSEGRTGAVGGLVGQLEEPEGQARG
jgi:flagellar protein FlbD